MREHKKLTAFELADEIVLLIYRATTAFPKEEVYGLTSQVLSFAPCANPDSPQPTAYSPQPTAHSPQPTAHSPQPTNILQKGFNS